MHIPFHLCNHQVFFTRELSVVGVVFRKIYAKFCNVANKLVALAYTSVVRQGEVIPPKNDLNA